MHLCFTKAAYTCLMSCMYNCLKRLLMHVLKPTCRAGALLYASSRAYHAYNQASTHTECSCRVKDACTCIARAYILASAPTLRAFCVKKLNFHITLA